MKKMSEMCHRVYTNLRGEGGLEEVDEFRFLARDVRILDQAFQQLL